MDEHKTIFSLFSMYKFIHMGTFKQTFDHAHTVYNTLYLFLLISANLFCY